MIRDDQAHPAEAPGSQAPFTKMAQKAPSSESPRSSPRISRSPVAVTPITKTRAPDTTLPLTRTFPWGHAEDLSWSTTW